MTISGNTSDSDASQADTLTAQPGVWARTTFFRITAILGRSRAESLLADYVGYLGRAEAAMDAAVAESVALRRMLHDLRSTSGMLGFNALSELCVVILSDADEASSPERLRRLRDVTRQSLEAARQHLTATSAITVAA